MIGEIRRIAGLLLLLLCGLLPLTSCGLLTADNLIDRIASKDKVDLVKHYVSAMQDGQLEIVARDWDMKYSDAHFADALSQTASLIPKEKPKSIRLVNATYFHSMPKGYSLYSIWLEYQFSHTWIVAGVVLETKAGSDKIWVAGMRINPLSQSLEETNAFRFAGKPALNSSHSRSRYSTCCLR
jgi:hypothetical protein